MAHVENNKCFFSELQRLIKLNVNYFNHSSPRLPPPFWTKSLSSTLGWLLPYICARIRVRYHDILKDLKGRFAQNPFSCVFLVTMSTCSMVFQAHLFFHRCSYPLVPSGLLDTQMQKIARVRAPKGGLADDNYCIEDKMWVPCAMNQRQNIFPKDQIIWWLFIYLIWLFGTDTDLLVWGPVMTIPCFSLIWCVCNKSPLIKKKQLAFPLFTLSPFSAHSRTIDDKYSRREEYRGFTQDFKEKDQYKPNVKIEYVDESGRKLTPKEVCWSSAFSVKQWSV